MRLGSSARKPGWTAAIPLALVAAGVWMYFAAPASEYVLGGRDPGVYMSEGIQIAQRQSLVTTDAIVAEVPASERDLFFPFYGETGYYSLRFMGFHLRDPEAGTVSGQFPQGYPIWIAIAYGLDGLTGTRRVIAWWAILGVLAVYFAGARLIGPLPAAAAAGLLTVHVIQTWYARYPNSEIVTQALLFAAFLAHAYAHEDEDPFFGPVAASLLGLALLTRFPVVLAVGAAGAASFLALVSGHRVRAGFLVTLTAVAGRCRRVLLDAASAVLRQADRLRANARAVPCGDAGGRWRDWLRAAVGHSQATGRRGHARVAADRADLRRHDRRHLRHVLPRAGR